MSLLELNHHLACAADQLLMEMADSLQRTTGIEYYQLPLGGWKSKSAVKTRDILTSGETPKFNEKWNVRFITRRLDGTMISDTEGIYTIRKYDLPLAVEDALEEMYAGETEIVLAPWYCAYGIHGNDFVAGYENVIFEVTLGEKKN